MQVTGRTSPMRIDGFEFVCAAPCAPAWAVDLHLGLTNPETTDMSDQTRNMRVWVDADACPAAIREILYRAAARHHVLVTMVADRMVRTPPSPYLSAIQVPRGFDAADREIAERVRPADIVVTADIPLAAQAVERGARVLDPRGETYDAGNVRERLSMRDFMEGLRQAGVQTGGPAPLSQADRHAFARQLERMLAHAAAPDTAPRGS